MSDLAIMEVVDDDAPEFFAPCASDLVDSLIGQYQGERREIEQVAAIVAGNLGTVIHYFIEGNQDRHERYAPDVRNLFCLDGAVKNLNATYWAKTMSMTDVYDSMPQKRRDEWNKSITDMTTPDFTEDAVRPTINELLASRHKFFAERVDGIFRSLSGEHVTNVPEGFSRRMIIAHLISSYGTTNHDRVGFINDLRAVVAKFMGRDEPRWNSSSCVVDTARRERRGEWVTIDGGALRLRAYKCGTAHLEVHPDIAYRLNQVLASIYPMAIPAQFRAKPKKQSKNFVMMGRPLPFAVLDLLSDTKPAVNFIKQDDWRNPYRREKIPNSAKFDKSYSWEKAGKTAQKEAENVLAIIGGVKSDEEIFMFDYDPMGVISEIVTSGCIPDQKAHQFYPTPESVAQVAAEMADICEFDRVLEPSAGQGDLAAHLSGVITCVEISPLHCTILKARGFITIQADFLQWAETAPQFERVVLNPPFSENRWKLHVDAAARLVRAGGRLVAILPASAKGKDILPGWSVEWSQVFSNEFAGTSVSVVIACGVKS